MRYATMDVYMRKAFEAARDTHVPFGRPMRLYMRETAERLQHDWLAINVRANL